MVALLKLGSLLDFVKLVRLLHNGKSCGTEVGTVPAKVLLLDQKLPIKTECLCTIVLPLLECALLDQLFRFLSRFW